MGSILVCACVSVCVLCVCVPLMPSGGNARLSPAWLGISETKSPKRERPQPVVKPTARSLYFCVHGPHLVSLPPSFCPSLYPSMPSFTRWIWFPDWREGTFTSAVPCHLHAHLHNTLLISISCFAIISTTLCSYSHGHTTITSSQSICFTHFITFCNTFGVVLNSDLWKHSEGNMYINIWMRKETLWGIHL